MKNEENEKRMNKWKKRKWRMKNEENEKRMNKWKKKEMENEEWRKWKENE